MGKVVPPAERLEREKDTSIGRLAMALPFPPHPATRPERMYAHELR